MLNFDGRQMGSTAPRTNGPTAWDRRVADRRHTTSTQGMALKQLAPVARGGARSAGMELAPVAYVCLPIYLHPKSSDKIWLAVPQKLAK